MVVFFFCVATTAMAHQIAITTGIAILLLRRPLLTVPSVLSSLLLRLTMELLIGKSKRNLEKDLMGTIQHQHIIHLNKVCIVWKNKKFTFTEKIFREINTRVTYNTIFTL